MSSPLIDRLTEELNYPLLDLSNINEFLKQNDYSVLFFTEDIKRFPESNDVAVVLPEILKSFPDLIPAVIARTDEKNLQKLYAFRSWPALVFMQGEQYLGVLTGIKDWMDYLTDIPVILASPPSKPHVVSSIPVVTN
jgi:hydrogenase-1 operon protein HyaE